MKQKLCLKTMRNWYTEGGQFTKYKSNVISQLPLSPISLALYYIKETFSKKIKWKIQFDHIFWSPAMIWKFWITTELACLELQNKSTERRQIQLALFCQKYWSNSFFHFQFLEKFSFKYWFWWISALKNYTKIQNCSGL